MDNQKILEIEQLNIAKKNLNQFFQDIKIDNIGEYTFRRYIDIHPDQPDKKGIPIGAPSSPRVPLRGFRGAVGVLLRAGRPPPI